MKTNDALGNLREETLKYVREIDDMLQGIGVNQTATKVSLVLICLWPPGSLHRMPVAVDRLCYWMRSRCLDVQPLKKAWEEAYSAYECWCGMRGGEQENFLFDVIPGKFTAFAQCLWEITDNNALWPEKKEVQSPGRPAAPARTPKEKKRKAPGRKKRKDAAWAEMARNMRAAKTPHKTIAQECKIPLADLEKFFKREDARKKRKEA